CSRPTISPRPSPTTVCELPLAGSSHCRLPQPQRLGLRMGPQTVQRLTLIGISQASWYTSIHPLRNRLFATASLF
ncbi:MAG: hypothetical protein KAV87_37870, partial [Desulfobacteraceae bacterium]|nr:hypothetical protein [Desulfobacteraceae bacterium]